MNYKPNLLQFNPAAPATFTSTAGIYLGLAGSFTAKSSGRVLITISCNALNTTTTNGVLLGARVGTQAAPAFGDPFNSLIPVQTVGIKLWQVDRFEAINVKQTFSKIVGWTAMIVGTTYFIDMVAAMQTDGAGQVSNISISVKEK